MSGEELAFRLFYTGSYTCLSGFFVLLTLVTPGDMIYQSISNHSWKNFFVVIGVYLMTLLVALFLYVLRMRTNIKSLAEIPKGWVPIDKPDVALKVHEYIMDKIVRSAVIAQQSRPRDYVLEERGRLDPYLTIPRTEEPPWGRIEHPGWTSPSCTDLPSCRFWPVITGLPHVLEARAVSLAPEVIPRNTGAEPVGDEEELGDLAPSGSETSEEHVLRLLARPRRMCLRSYVDHLSSLGMLRDPDLGRSFVRLYERARFSQKTLREEEFRSLMNMFAQLLREMVLPSPDVSQQLPSDSASRDSYRSCREVGSRDGESNDIDTTTRSTLLHLPRASRSTDQLSKERSIASSSKRHFILNSNLGKSHQSSCQPQRNVQEDSSMSRPGTFYPGTLYALSPQVSNNSQVSLQSVVTAIRFRGAEGSTHSVTSRRPSDAALEALERLED
ncbi:hypothetical protein KEM54_005858 [Ascosphaera aggregata]|nr:hypothetical protein KEM54_005858 [Ascosphaera aggregata]